MWQNYGPLAEQKLQEMYDDAAMRRSLPNSDREFRPIRTLLGTALMRWGERLARPVGAPVTHG